MIDVIIPTYRRTALLKRILPYYLAQSGVASVIIVEDGPISSEISALACNDNSPKVITISTGCQSGAPAAKKLGLQHATGEFAAFGEDDAFPSSSYYATLAAYVREGRADVISGAVHYLASIDNDWRAGIITHVENYPSFGVTNEQGGVFYGAATQALYLGRLDVLLRYPPDPGYAGNGWREETDPLLSMWADDLKIALDPSAICYHLPTGYQQGGGQHAGGRLVYEYWCLHNDVRFFKKHRNMPQAAGLSRSGVSICVVAIYRPLALQDRGAIKAPPPTCRLICHN